MSTSPPVAETFREIFCTQYGVPADLYGVTVLRLTLYPHARWLADVSPSEFLASDRAFVAAVGRLTRWRSFDSEVSDFQHAPENRRFLRRRLRLRVSVARMRELFSEVMGGTRSTRQHASRLRDEAASEPGSFAAD